jgi:hypothetical protein
MIRTRYTHAISLLAMLSLAAIAAGCSGTSTRSDSADKPTSEDAGYLARAETQESEKLICRREQPTGSRISERVCMTADDWDKIEQQSQEMLDRATRKAQQYPDQQ